MWDAMLSRFLVVCCIAIACTAAKVSDTLTEDREYCIVGAGPAGLQMGHFMGKQNRDYVIFEKHTGPGWFFEVYPRHRTLISINKRHTGSNNTEFNMRHDWNSLLCDDPALQFTKYSKRYYPPADRYVDYLRDFAARYALHVRYASEIVSVSRRAPHTFKDKPAAGAGANGGRAPFYLTDQTGQLHRCQAVIVATGAFQPNIPGFVGIEHAVGYENISTNPDDYEGKTVLVLGKGNSAFETANAIFEGAAYVQLISSSRVRLSWATHYVGDIRGINNMFLDNYQLKSLDAISEADPAVLALRKTPEGIYLHPPDSIDKGTKLPTEGRMGNMLRETDNGTDSKSLELLQDNFGFRKPFDMVIRCLGFHFDRSIFPGDTRPRMVGFAHGKYPEINSEYESTNIPGLYFMGTIAHSLDWRKSSGGFVHGFRYTVRALHRMLENKHHQAAWPSVRVPLRDILTKILERINESAGLYQMFSHFVDVVLLPGQKTRVDVPKAAESEGMADIEIPDIDTTGFGLSREEDAQAGMASTASPVNAAGAGGQSAVYLEEVPLSVVLGRAGLFQEVTGFALPEHFLTIEFRYGENYSGPAKDVFAMDRVTVDPARAHMCNFLHPVISYWHSYNRIKAVAVHHMLEDLLTDWTAPVAHIKPFATFLERWLPPTKK